LEAKIPDKSDVAAYQTWKSQIESVRMKIRGQALDALKNARVAAMTTTRAVFTYDEIAATQKRYRRGKTWTEWIWRRILTETEQNRIDPKRAAA
jgi:hypothetical protein